MKKLVVLASILLPGLASAQYSLNLATGLDASGNVQTAGGLPDANWTITGTAVPFNTPVAYTVDPSDPDWYPGWFANGPDSSWICGNPYSTANGYLVATRTFNLTATEAATAQFQNLEWSIDDEGVLLLNGNQLSFIGDGNWGSFTPVTVSSNYFVAGTNTLTMMMTWSDVYLEAERLQGTIVATPEPSSFAGVGACLLGLLAVRRRRK